jgi:hypothetical protein
MESNVIPARTARNLKIFAALLVIASIALLFAEVTDDGFTDSWATSFRSDAAPAFITLLAACTGGAVAVGLWSAKRWARSIYLIWALLYVAASWISDSRVEPTAWKVVLGTAPTLILTGIGALYLHEVFAPPDRS